MTTPEPPHASDNPTPASAAPSATRIADSAALIHAAEADTLPTSFGVFKPIGHVMIGLPTQAQVDALVATLHSAGWPTSGVRQFAPSESVAELRAMIENASILAGIGYEITILKRYLALAEQGTLWLLVHADCTDRAATVADAARTCGATTAVHYRTLTVEELIP